MNARAWFYGQSFNGGTREEVAARYILRGLSELGREWFYTGRAGEKWVSDNRDAAFQYECKATAQHKALMFNRTTDLHGLRFIAVTK